MTLVHGGHSSQSPCTKTCPLRLVLQIGVHRVATNDPMHHGRQTPWTLFAPNLAKVYGGAILSGKSPQ